MEQAITTTESDYDIDAFLEKRTEFIKKVNAIMQEKQDFHIIQGKKSLGKGGAEKIASIFGWQAEFIADQDTLKMFGNVTGLVAYICNLTKNKEFVGQGRGAASVGKNQNDPNKTVKMSQKSAFVDAVLRSSGLSDFFTQDIEDMEMPKRDVAFDDNGDVHYSKPYTPNPANVSSLPKSTPTASPWVSYGSSTDIPTGGVRYVSHSPNKHITPVASQPMVKSMRELFEKKIGEAKNMQDLDSVGKAIRISPDITTSEKALLRGKYKNRKEMLTTVKSEPATLKDYEQNGFMPEELGHNPNQMEE